MYEKNREQGNLSGGRLRWGPASQIIFIEVFEAQICVEVNACWKYQVYTNTILDFVSTNHKYPLVQTPRERKKTGEILYIYLYITFIIEITF